MSATVPQIENRQSSIGNSSNHGRPERCLNCNHWHGDYADRDRKDGRPNTGICDLTGERKGRFGVCAKLSLKFTPPDYAAALRANDAHYQAVLEWRQQHGPNGPLDEDAVRARAAIILEELNRLAKAKEKV